jgi:hypothetical protein
MAQKMGEGLGRGEILFRTLPQSGALGYNLYKFICV